MNWFEAQTLMESARDKSKGKPIANNTRLYEMRSYTDKKALNYAIKLHGNIIIEIYPDYTKLYDGGRATVTTKARLNQFGPVHVYQRDFNWFVTEWNTHQPEPFVNGMVIAND
jgi:hypothetical protein|tara:strand:- start:178 stop:516 length:339 start_codon:yes stop_codon:yes gene_type:complete